MCYIAALVTADLLLVSRETNDLDVVLAQLLAIQKCNIKHLELHRALSQNDQF
jgi:hypothetical protein